MQVESKVPKLRFKEFKGSWQTIALANVADNKTKWSFTGGPFGSDLTTKDYTDEGVRILQLQNIGDSTFYNGYKIYTSKQKADELISANIFPHEILIAKMGDPVARACVVPALEDRYLMASDGIRLVPNNKFFETKYVFHYLCTSKFRKKALSLSTGSTRKRIGLTDLRKIKINVPSFQEQQKISTFLSSVDKKIELLQKKKEKLEEYKKGMMQKIFSREIKFKDSGSKSYPNWNAIKLGTLLKYEQPTKYLVKDTEYDDSFKTPVLTAGKTFILGYTNEEDGIFEERNLPVIIFDDFTTAYKFVDFPFKVKSSAIKILINKNDAISDIRFIFYRMSAIRFNVGAEHKRYWISAYSLTNIDLPIIEEQQKIATFLSSIDKKIELIENQLTQTQQFKKALLQQMFV